MPSTFRRPRGQTYELLPRASHESDPDTERDGFIHAFHRQSTRSSPSWMPDWLSRIYAYLQPSLNIIISPCGGRRRFSRPLYCIFFGVPYLLIILIVLTTIFRPSYTHPPPHYKELRSRAVATKELGRGNINNEKIFIAASIYDHEGELLGGAWGKAVLDLVDLLGPSNVYLSIYENDADPKAMEALDTFRNLVTCESTIFTEHLRLDEISRVTLPTGESRIKRMAFLAEVRNRALRPLEKSTKRYDKVLYINDVIFDPIDAAQLLFSTGMDLSTGRTTYGAACAVDFINAFKFYDRFATRDLEGRRMGIPFYPWFTSAGDAASRKDVLSQSDSVRVRSCWGGMTAFEAKWFQDPVPAINASAPPDPERKEIATIAQPIRFRYETDPYWDASECCLIHADLTFARQGREIIGTDGEPSSGIVMNPYVRVAYDSSALSWLSWTRRTERLYSPIHDLLNWIVGFPRPNRRRLEEPGDSVVETVWVYDDDAGTSGKGSYQKVQRVVEPGRFCGGRQLLVINEHPLPGEKNWEDVPIPERERQ